METRPHRSATTVDDAPTAGRYAAFLSYRHVEPDRTWAKWLHRALETYRTPAALVRERGLPRRVGRVFRDEEEVPAAVHLSEAIRTALQESRWLVVVCSPRTPASEWVDREIVRFREMGRGDRILALLIEGEPRDAFPTSLRAIRPAVVGATGEDADRALSLEPLAADVRPRPTESAAQRKRAARLGLLSVLLGCGFDDLRRREQERHARRLRWVASGLAALVLVLAGLTAFALLARDEADRATRREAGARAEAERQRDEVLRLADAKRVADLVAEEPALWPVHPDLSPAMASWLERARRVVGNRALHEASMAALGPEGDSSEDEVSRAWRRQVLTEMLKGLDVLEDPKTRAGLVRDVAARWGEASALRRRSVDDHAQAWADTISALADSSRNPLYGALELRPQVGLVPLGQDTESRLFEFAHVGSGSLPTRDPTTGLLAQAEDAAIVLVLLPGGTFAMGAQGKDAEGPNFDPAADKDESPVHEVRLSPFFLSKYECTQGQWAALCGAANACGYPAGVVVGNKVLTRRHPVEKVPWTDGTLWARRRGLALPTEAQWEHACRAGTTTPWWTGREASSVSKGGNIADAYLKANGGDPHGSYTLEANDGHGIHAPVGSLAPNAFGLYDMAGNVFEWCQDIFFGDYYSKPEAREKDPANVGPGEDPRIIRGGGWRFAAPAARSASRSGLGPGSRFDSLGLRFARPITTD